MIHWTTALAFLSSGCVAAWALRDPPDTCGYYGRAFALLDQVGFGLIALLVTWLAYFIYW